MSEIVKDRIIVLKTYLYGESSAVVHAIARKHGKIRFLAKGARRKNSPISSALCTGVVCESVFYLRPSRGLALLKECEAAASCPAGRDLDRLCLFLAGIELIDRTMQDGEGDEGIFDLVEKYLSLVESAADPWALFLAFEISLLGKTGLLPSVEACAGCGHELAGESFSVDPIEGTVKCKACQRGGGRILSQEASEALRRMIRAGLSSAQESLGASARIEIGELIHGLMTRHMEGYRMPNALKLCRGEKV